MSLDNKRAGKLSAHFRIKPADTYIWNLSELVDFLIDNQNQHIILDNNTEGCCAETIGLYHWLDKFKFASVTFCTANVLEQHQSYQIVFKDVWKFLSVTRPIESTLHVWNKKTIFGLLYGRPLWHRLGLAAHMLSHHASISTINMLPDPNIIDARQLFEVNQLWQNHLDSFVNFAKILMHLPYCQANIEPYTPGSTLTDGFVAQTKNIYSDFFIDLVAETFTSGNCFFITEKTVRPMLLKKPFIIFGSRNYLVYLRQMGFRTFGDFWDENYDGYEGADRYIRILELIDTLAGKSFDELESMYWDMQYTLNHNYNLLINQKFHRNIKYLK